MTIPKDVLDYIEPIFGALNEISIVEDYNEIKIYVDYNDLFTNKQKLIMFSRNENKGKWIPKELI